MGAGGLKPPSILLEPLMSLPAVYFTTLIVESVFNQ